MSGTGGGPAPGRWRNLDQHNAGHHKVECNVLEVDEVGVAVVVAKDVGDPWGVRVRTLQGPVHLGAVDRRLGQHGGGEGSAQEDEVDGARSANQSVEVRSVEAEHECHDDEKIDNDGRPQGGHRL